MKEHILNHCCRHLQYSGLWHCHCKVILKTVKPRHRGIPAPFSDVEVFMQEKWRIAGDRPGSGNTANIGSIRGRLSDFQEGNGLFRSEAEFLAYWRGYGTTARERRYRNIEGFRALQETESYA